MFNNTRLDKVNFEGSPFVDCTFIGELSEVCFQDKTFGMGEWPPNKLERIDFSRARSRSVEFRGLDLDDVRLPNDDEHIILNDYPRTLDELLAALQYENFAGSRGLRAYLGCYRKWVGPAQKIGVLNKRDLLEIAGKEGLHRVLETLGAT